MAFHVCNFRLCYLVGNSRKTCEEKHEVARKLFTTKNWQDKRLDAETVISVKINSIEASISRSDLILGAYAFTY